MCRIMSTHLGGQMCLIVGEGRLGQALIMAKQDREQEYKSVSARAFLMAGTVEQDVQLQGCAYLMWCGQCYQDDESLNTLAEAMKRHPTLTFVDFSDSDSGAASAKALQLEGRSPGGVGRVWCVRKAGVAELLRGHWTAELYGGSEEVTSAPHVGLDDVVLQHRGNLRIAASNDAMVHATIGKWIDSAWLAFATFVWTFLVRRHTL